MSITCAYCLLPIDGEGGKSLYDGAIVCFECWLNAASFMTSDDQWDDIPVRATDDAVIPLLDLHSESTPEGLAAGLQLRLN